MDLYIGQKMVKAKPMTLGEYNTYRGWKIPEDENPEDEGYLVKYGDGEYEAWIPEYIFNKEYSNLNINSGLDLKTLKSDLITNEHTLIEYGGLIFNAPHNYLIKDIEGNLLCGIHFQEGPIKEVECNGIFMEDLIAICINRLENFQNSNFRCRENAVAITKLEESLMWLRKITNNRVRRGVQGINKV